MWQQWHCHSPHWSTACHPDSRKWSPHQVCAFHIHCYGWCRRWAETSFTPGADVVPGGHQLMSGATAFLVDTQLALQTLAGVAADTLAAGSMGVFAWSLQDIKLNTGDHKLGLLHVDTEPFTFHASLPCLKLGDTLLLGVLWWAPGYQLENLPWHTSTDLKLRKFIKIKY